MKKIDEELFKSKIKDGSMIRLVLGTKYVFIDGFSDSILGIFIINTEKDEYFELTEKEAYIVLSLRLEIEYAGEEIVEKILTKHFDEATANLSLF